MSLTAFKKDSEAVHGPNRLVKGAVGLAATTALILGTAVGASAAVPTLASVPDDPSDGKNQTSISITNGDAVGGNVYEVEAEEVEENVWVAEVEYSITADTGVAPPAPIGSLLNPSLTNTGFYAILGNVNNATWRPSESAASSTRTAGPSAWYNPHGAVAYNGNVLDDQFAYTPNSPVTGSFEVEIQYDSVDDEYVITGAGIGSGGTYGPYSIPSDEPVFQVYTLGALGTAGPSTGNLEQVVNVDFVNIP